MSSIWIDINYGEIETADNGERIEHVRLKDRIEFSSLVNIFGRIPKEHILRTLSNKLDEMGKVKLRNKEAKVYHVIGDSYEELSITEISNKEVTEEELLEAENIKKVDNKYLNNYGRYIKNFQRIVRTSND